MKNTLRPLFVVKICSKIVEDMRLMGIFPTINDCFNVSVEAQHNLAVEYKGETVVPTLGSKLIGSYRDKGCAAGIMSKYVPIISYKLNNEQEINNFTNLLTNLNKKFEIKGDRVNFIADIISDSAYGRDNVSSLVLQGILDLEANIQGKDIELTPEEANNLNLEEMLNTGKYDQQVYIVETETGKVVADLGECLVLLEKFFWQPSHDNALCCGEKDISFSYHQCVDGILIQFPTIYKHFMNSLDKTRLKEYFLLTNTKIQDISVAKKEKQEDKDLFKEATKELVQNIEDFIA